MELVSYLVIFGLRQKKREDKSSLSLSFSLCLDVRNVYQFNVFSTFLNKIPISYPLPIFEFSTYRDYLLLF
jgi:hypothetical protein